LYDRFFRIPFNPLHFVGGEKEKTDYSKLAKLKREWRVFRRFFPLIYPYKSKMVAILLLIMVAAPLTEIGVFLTRYIVDDVVLATGIPTYERLQLLLIIISFQVLLWVITNIIGAARNILGYYMDISISTYLSGVFYKHLNKLSLAFQLSRPVGEHMFRVASDPTSRGREGAISLITTNLPQVFALLNQIIWTTVLLIFIDWRLALIVYIYVLPYTAIQHWLFSKLKKYLFELKEEAQAVTAELRDGIKGLKTIKSFGLIDYQVKKYTKQVFRERRAWWKYILLTLATSQVILLGLYHLFTQGMWLYIITSLMKGYLTLGDYFVVFALIVRLDLPLQNLATVLQYIRLQIVPAERMLETLDVKPEIMDSPDASVIKNIKGKIEFRDVNFEYKSGEPVLKNFNLIITPGESIGFVGPSGSGKSTIMYLLHRLYEPNRGEIFIDNKNLTSIKTKSVLDQMAIVLQDTHLFNGSFADNIRYGELKASLDKIKNAAKEAGIAEFIEKTDEGYNRSLSEGLKISGGQQQRIGLARALIRNPKILILDEATSSLDYKSENKILSTLKNLMKNKTTIMISHRLNPIKICKRIVVINNGEIVEEGSHNELLKRQGFYHKMWIEQQSEDI